MRVESKRWEDAVNPQKVFSWAEANVAEISRAGEVEGGIRL